jgi:hypothetical protein
MSARKWQREAERRARKAARHDQYDAANRDMLRWFRGIVTVGALAGVYQDVGTCEAHDEFGAMLLAALNRRGRCCSPPSTGELDRRARTSTPSATGRAPCS